MIRLTFDPNTRKEETKETDSEPKLWFQILNINILQCHSANNKKQKCLLQHGYLTWPHSSSLFSLFLLTTTYIYNIFLTSIHLELFHYMAMRIKTTLITAADRLFWFGLFWDCKFFERSRKSLNSSSTAMHTSHVRSHGCGLVTSTWGWLYTMACSARRLHPYWLTLLTPHPCVFCILVMLHKLLSDLQ